MLTEEEFSKLVLVWKSIYTSPNFLPDRTSVKAWYSNLNDLPQQALAVAFNLYMAGKNKQFPPSCPGALRELVVEAMLDIPDWSEAWEKVRKCQGKYGSNRMEEAMSEFDEVTKTTVKRMGWSYICQSPYQDKVRDNFEKIFSTISAREKERIALPIQTRGKLTKLRQQFMPKMIETDVMLLDDKYN